MTPYERLYKEKPNFANVPEWGQQVWVYNSTGSKLDARALQARWVDYDTDRYACPSSILARQELHFSRTECEARLANDSHQLYHQATRLRWHLRRHLLHLRLPPNSLRHNISKTRIGVIAKLKFCRCYSTALSVVPFWDCFRFVFLQYLWSPDHDA
jgi:hypothetical protein